MTDSATRTAVLIHDLPTPIGTFATGVRVTVLGIQDRRVKLCLDATQHPSWHCHTVTVPKRWLRGVHPGQQLDEIDYGEVA